MAHKLTAEELLASATATFTVQVPASLLRPAREGSAAADAANGSDIVGDVVLRPLQVRDVDRAVRAAREQRILTSVLLVQQSLVSPALTVEQVATLPAGVAQFLTERVNAISGLSLEPDDLDKAVRAPLARACFVLSREFGWTPNECAELTVGQVLLYLEMLARDERPPVQS
jgi:hypothetical protein